MKRLDTIERQIQRLEREKAEWHQAHRDDPIAGAVASLGASAVNIRYAVFDALQPRLADVDKVLAGYGYDIPGVYEMPESLATSAATEAVARAINGYGTALRVYDDAKAADDRAAVDELWD
jgi:hypothetical protein